MGTAASATVIVPITLTLATGAASPQTVAPNFDALTQLASHSNAFVKEQDGYEAGELATFSIESTGIIVGSYTNGLVRQIGQVALANFTNPEGLLKMGSNIYNFTPNSGSARIGLPGLDGRGEIRSRSLEMSNVDLVNEFTELITSSRGFQASSRVISTSDEVLMELINIKR